MSWPIVSIDIIVQGQYSVSLFLGVTAEKNTLFTFYEDWHPSIFLQAKTFSNHKILMAAFQGKNIV